MDWPPDKKLLLLFLVGIWLVGGIYYITAKSYPEEQPELKDDQLLLVSGNSVKAAVVPYLLRPTVYGVLVDCLAWYESRNDENALGKAGECGELQFMPSTFQHFCVDRYKLPDDIWSSEIQRLCSDYMIQDGYLNHWTTAKKCI